MSETSSSRPTTFLGGVDALCDMTGLDDQQRGGADAIDDAADDLRDVADRVDEEAACDLDEIAGRLEDVADRLRSG